MKFLFGFAASAAVFCFSASAANYSGNGNSVFDGPIGLSSLILTDDRSSVSGTFDKAPNGFNDVSTFSFNVSQLSITPDTGAIFGPFAIDLSNNGFRSNETVAGNDVGQQGWTPFLQTAFGTYTVVPEPSTLTLFGLPALLGLVCLRRKK